MNETAFQDYFEDKHAICLWGGRNNTRQRLLPFGYQDIMRQLRKKIE